MRVTPHSAVSQLTQKRPSGEQLQQHHYLAYHTDAASDGLFDRR